MQPTNTESEPSADPSPSAGSVIAPNPTNQAGLEDNAADPQPNLAGRTVFDPPPEPPDPPSPPPEPLFPVKKPKRSRKKLILILLPVLVLLIGGGAAAYFGYYLPNQPEKLWETALSRSAKGYDKLSEYASTPKKTKGVSLKGSFKLNGSVAADGNLEGASSDNNSSITGSVSAAGVKIHLDLRTISSNGNTPDIYFKVDGLAGLGGLLGGGDPGLTKELNGLNNQWYLIDHTLFDQFAKGANANTQITSDDISSILKAVGDASKQNVFTNDPKKRAFEVKQNVGKELQDGHNVYHYKVGINKENLKTYVTNLCNNLKNSKLNKFFGGSANVEDTLGCKDAAKSIDKYDANRTADVWVDTQTKLIHKIRFSEKNNSGNYWDFSQDYKGGSEVPFSITYHNKSEGTTSEGAINLKLNTQTNTLTLSGKFTQSGEAGQSGSFSLIITPTNEPVKVQAPQGAKNFIQLLNDLGFSDALNQSKAPAGSTILQ